MLGKGRRERRSKLFVANVLAAKELAGFGTGRRAAEPTPSSIGRGGVAAWRASRALLGQPRRRVIVKARIVRHGPRMTPLGAHLSYLRREGVTKDGQSARMFDAESEFDAGHIRLARDCDLIVVAPATADLMAKMAQGHADDLASAILLAANRPILLAPAMNPLMWNNAATRRNVAQLERDGVAMVGPNAGEMAEAGEAGIGRMAEPIEIASVAERLLHPPQPRPLAGKRILITAGPTHEPIDPVRYIANRSSGKQGFAIAAAAQAAGANVVLILGPVELDDPPGMSVTRVESAREMLHAVEAALPADIAIFAAAVADWRIAHQGEQKLKKTSAGMPPLQLVENPDILATISKLPKSRPALVIGFAAETENLIENAKAKLARKGCDWIVANDVSPALGVMGGDRNTVHLLTRDADGVQDGNGIGVDIKIESWPVMTKEEVATTLVARIASQVEKKL